MAGDKLVDIPKSWGMRRLDQVSTVIDSLHKTPAYTNTGYPMVRVTDIKGGFLDLSEASCVSEEVFNEFTRRRVPQRGDIVFSRVGTYGNASYVATDAPFCLGQNTALICPGIDSRFLHLCLESPLVWHQIEKTVVGSTQKTISLKSIGDIQIPVPPKQELETIAYILGTLDDKIELNRRMNETLEAMARAIFKSWFVDFDPVRAKAEGHNTGLPKEIADLFPDSFEDSEMGEIPKGWRVGTLSEVAEVIDCLHSKKPERRDNGWPLLQLWNIRDDGLIDMTDTYYINETEYRNWVSRMEASPGDCVITNVGRVGAVAQIPEGLKAALGRNMTGIRCKSASPFPTLLIECLLSQTMRDEIVRKMDTGTILDALNVRNIPQLRLVLPHHDLLTKFEDLARPLRAKMERNSAENFTLAALRDALLPKLISGELRVKDAERFAEKAL